MRLFSWFSRPSMPAVCFISHAYADEDVVQELTTKLPRGVSPFIFPPITVSPDQRVSDDLVKAILNCGGLVYVDASQSSRSVWVNFERDYARRAGKPVFSYSADKRRFRRDRSRPLELPVFPSSSAHDRALVDEVTSFMKQERHFDLWTAQDLRAGTHFRRETESALESRLSRGGYVVAFISRSSLQSKYVTSELHAAVERWPEQILPALIDPVDLRDLPPMIATRKAVTLHRGEGQSLDWNRVDDLIVRIYDLVYRNTHGKR